MKLRLLKIILGIIIIFGFLWLFKILHLDIPKAEGNPLNPSKIANQTFLINSKQDTILTTNSGSLIVIHKNSFVNSYGQIIDGTIKISYKEVLTKEDIIRSGLTTTSHSRLLESGGMINIRAYNESQEIFLGDSSKIGFAISSETLESEMQLFKGQDQQGSINWTEPQPLLSDTTIVIIARYPWDQDKYTRDDAIRLGILYVDTLTGDRLFDDYGDILYNAPELETGEINSMVEGFEYADSANPVLNRYKQSLHQKYVFELFELGWANIDRFYKNEEASEVDLNIIVENLNDFGEVFVKLCFKSRNMQIGAYENQEGVFTLKPFGEVSPKLPIGEEVIVLATAYRDKNMYIDIKPHKIKNKQSIKMSLKPFSQEQLEKIIGDNI